MLTSETKALLRTIHDEVCAAIPHHQTATKSHVAVRILQAASEGMLSPDALRHVARNALTEQSLPA
jgi:hypothetical protein